MQRKAPKVLLARAIAAVVVTWFVVPAGLSGQELPPLGHRIEWLVRKAKSDRRTEIRAPGLSVEYFDGGLDKAAESQSVAIAQLMRSRSTIFQDHVVTWHKFRILEWLSRKGERAGSSRARPPEEGTPENTGELTVSVIGGTATLEGVRVIEDGELPMKLSPEKKYLLFLHVVRDENHGSLPGGPGGVFEISGDTIAPAWNTNKLALDLATRCGNSVGRLRSLLQAH